MNLSGKIVLITGASSGIGAATAFHMAKLGTKLVLTGRNEIELEKISRICEENSGIKPLLIVAELSNETDVQNIINWTIERHNRLDVLVNNAALFEKGSIEDTSLEQFDKIFNVNVRAVYQLTMLAVPYLKNSKGAIINVSSIGGTRSFTGGLAYCMSKSAVDQMTKCVALELASNGIKVNSVNPGTIKTAILKRGGLFDDASYAKFLERGKETHPLGRVGEPEEVAKVIAFLASDEASFITGTNVSVDGGRSATCLR